MGEPIVVVVVDVVVVVVVVVVVATVVVVVAVVVETSDGVVAGSGVAPVDDEHPATTLDTTIGTARRTTRMRSTDQS